MNKRSGLESRKRIINAAMDVFFRHGYAESNIRDIAKKAGISVGSIYLYFKNKEELYKTLITDKRREIGEATTLTVEQAESATEAITEYLRVYLRYALKHKHFILLHIKEHGFSFGTNEKRLFFLKQRKLIEKIILHGIQKGEFRKCNARETAKIILGSLRGVVLSMTLEEDYTIKPERLSEFVLHGLLSAEGNSI
jgi:AcrR family transcriptional regulator